MVLVLGAAEEDVPDALLDVEMDARHVLVVVAVVLCVKVVVVVRVTA